MDREINRYKYIDREREWDREVHREREKKERVRGT